MTSPYDTFKRQISLFEEIETQSDRGAAIVGVAWVEEELLEAIRASVHRVPKAWDRLFGRSGPLLSFSAKIDMAALLGIVSDAVRADLHTLRDIRNEFAHSVVTKTDDVLTFDSQHVKDKCQTISVAAHEHLRTPRAVFLRSCALLHSDFHIFAKLASATDSPYKIHSQSEQ